MRNIKSLLLKDLLIFKNYRKNIIFSFITLTILIFIGTTQRNLILAGTILFLLMFGLNGVSTFSYDEAQETDKYLLSLPISRIEIVISKYLFAFLDAIISLIIGFLISIMATLILKHHIPNISNDINYILIVLTGVSFLVCADIPCIYKWGVEKGRMQAVIVPVFLILFAGIIISLILLIYPPLYLILTSKTIIKYIPYLCLLAIIMMYSISFLISYFIFKNKDL